ncbi:MAG: hypothetical protein PHE55_05385 [Methylococcaceae bacterium]|nr:hypothetical protein [Methylococcaceae bacterium]
METLGKIRRRYFVNGETISQVARDFHLTRKTVRKSVRIFYNSLQKPVWRIRDTRC